MADDRCPSCGALVSPDAEWCGQCYTPLAAAATAQEQAPHQPVVTPGGGRLEVSEAGTTWVCPVCETTNGIELSACSMCGTPFARLFQETEAVPEIVPQTAAVWSLAWPGLGHWKTGRRADGVARMVLFGWTFGALMVLLISRFGKGGLGPTVPLFLLFALSSLAIYVVSALDAYRIAAGDDPILGSRALLWVSAGLVVLSVVIASFITLPGARR